ADLARADEPETQLYRGARPGGSLRALRHRGLRALVAALMPAALAEGRREDAVRKRRPGDRARRAAGYTRSRQSGRAWLVAPRPMTAPMDPGQKSGKSQPKNRSVIAPQQTRELPLNLHFFRSINLRIIGAIGRIEPDHAVFAAQVLESGFLVADERHHDFAIARDVGAANEGVITVQNAGLDHRIARNFERIVIAGPQKRGRDRESGLAFERLNRQTCGNAAVERDLDHVIGGLRPGAGWGHLHYRIVRRGGAG